MKIGRSFTERRRTPSTKRSKSIRLNYGREVRRELRALLSEVTEDERLRDVLDLGLGLNVHFKKPEDARAFAEDIEARLMRSIKEHFDEARDTWS